MTTGRDLRRERRLAEVKATDVAREAGISRQWLWVLETGRAAIDEEAAGRILAAIEKLRTVAA
jgi:transcriptional regulator with XRE-family HTH domain